MAFLQSFLADAAGAAPVFMREVRSRMRHPWVWWVLGGYLLLLVPAGLYVLYRYHATAAPVGGQQWEAMQQAHQVGLLFAVGLLAVQLLLISLLAPALTCSSFATERAKRTLVFTLLTPLSTRALVDGKLYFVLFYLGLLQLATMPLCAVSSLFGGLSPLDLLAGYGLLLAYAYLLGAIGLYASARTARAGMAALWSYLAIAAVPLACPYLLLPYAGLYLLVVMRDPALVFSLVESVPIPAAVLPLGLLCVFAARWCLGETAAVLDAERHRWGTYAPPLPRQNTHATSLTPEMPAPAPRRW